jgi:large subunit ribosomal protein L10
VIKVSRKDRENLVSDLSKRFRETNGLIVLDYTSLNVEMITELRRQVKNVESEFKVSKNTLLRIASKGTDFEQINNFFVGQTAVMFIDGDPVLAAKVLTKFAKDNLKSNPDSSFKIRAGVLDKNTLSNADIDQLGNLPNRQVLLGQLVGLFALPLTGFVSVLADIPRKFLRVLAAISDQKK